MAEDLKITQTQTSEAPVNTNTNDDNSLNVKQNTEQPSVTAEQMRKEYKDLIVKQKDGLLDGRDQDRLKELKDKLGEKGASIDATPEDLHEEKFKKEHEKRDPLFVKKDILQYEEEQLFKLLNWLGDKALDLIEDSASWAKKVAKKGAHKLKDKIKEHSKEKSLPDNPMTKHYDTVNKACDTNKQTYIDSNETELKNTKDSLHRIRHGQATDEDQQTEIYQQIQGLTPKEQKKALKDYEKDKETDTKEKNQIRTIASGLVKAKHNQNAMGYLNPTPPSNDELNQEIATMEAHIRAVAAQQQKPSKFLDNLEKLTEKSNKTIDKNVHEGKYLANEKYNKKYDKWYYKAFSNETKKSWLMEGHENQALTDLYDTLGLDEHGNIPGQNQAARSQQRAQQNQTTQDNTQTQEASAAQDVVNDNVAHGNETEFQRRAEEKIEEIKEKDPTKTEETIEQELSAQPDTPTSSQPEKEVKPELTQQEEATQPELVNMPEDKQIERIIELKNELNTQYGRNINVEEAYNQFNLLKRKDPNKALDQGAGILPEIYREAFIETIKEMNPATFPPENKEQTEQKTNTPSQTAKEEIKQETSKDDFETISTIEFPERTKNLTMPEALKEEKRIANIGQSALAENNSAQATVDSKQKSYEARRRHYEQRINRFKNRDNQQSNDNQPKNLAQLRAQKTLAERKAHQ